MLTCCNWLPKYTDTGNLRDDLMIFIRRYFLAPSIFSMECFCVITTNHYLICLKKNLEKQTSEHLSPQKI